ncbi:MAG: hypothetical protein CL623_07975 [Arcobacter sp.]|nr:hypothetical protein [Arcobacter sp.]
MQYLILLITFFICSFASEHKRILFISSYDRSFPTVKKQLQGIKEVLDDKIYLLQMKWLKISLLLVL